MSRLGTQVLRLRLEATPEFEIGALNCSANTHSTEIHGLPVRTLIICIPNLPIGESDMV